MCAWALEKSAHVELSAAGGPLSTGMSTSPVVLARNESSSRPGSFHEVRRGADGVVYCTCPSWRFQKNSPSNRTCKHIESWKRSTVVGGKSLMDVMGPGPEAVRAPRKPRARKAAPVVTAPVMATVRHDTIPCPPPAAEEFVEPEWESDRPTSWERLNKTA